MRREDALLTFGIVIAVGSAVPAAMGFLVWLGHDWRYDNARGGRCRQCEFRIGGMEMTPHSPPMTPGCCSTPSLNCRTALRPSSGFWRSCTIALLASALASPELRQRSLRCLR